MTSRKEICSPVDILNIKLNGIRYSKERNIISKKKLKSVDDYLYFLQTEPYKSILNILRIAPSFNATYNEGLLTRELRKLIVKDSKIDKKRIDKKRLVLLQRFEEYLSMNKTNEVKLHQKLKIGEIRRIKTEKEQERLRQQNVAAPKKYAPKTSSTEYNIFNPYLSKLERTGMIQRKKGFCSIPKYNTPLFFRNIFKIQDIKLLEECPVNCIYSIDYDYDKDRTGKTIIAKGITIYGLEKRHSQIDDILDSAFQKLSSYVDNMYYEKLCNIVIDECKKIQNNKLRKSIENWCSQMKNINLLYPPRYRNEISPMPSGFKFVPPENLEKEFKEITEKIWNQLNKECPPIGILILL